MSKYRVAAYSRGSTRLDEYYEEFDARTAFEIAVNSEFRYVVFEEFDKVREIWYVRETYGDPNFHKSASEMDFRSELRWIRGWADDAGRALDDENEGEFKRSVERLFQRASNFRDVVRWM